MVPLIESHSAVLSFIFLVVSIAVLKYWHRRRSGSVSGNTSHGSENESSITVSQLRTLPESPLVRMPPDAKLSLGALTSELETYCDDLFRTLLSGDTVNIVVQGVTEKIVGGDIAYRFSEHAVNLIRRGEATIAIHRETEKYLPFIQDGSGKIIEHARGIVSLAPKLAQLASLGVAAAHLVAG